MKSIRTKIIVGIILCSTITALMIGGLAMVNSASLASNDTQERMQMNSQILSKELRLQIWIIRLQKLLHLFQMKQWRA